MFVVQASAWLVVQALACFTRGGTHQPTPFHRSHLRSLFTPTKSLKTPAKHTKNHRKSALGFTFINTCATRVKAHSSAPLFAPDSVMHPGALTPQFAPAPGIVYCDPRPYVSYEK